MKMSMCSTSSAKPSSFSVRDILDLPEAKSPCSLINNTPVSSAPSLPVVSTTIDGLSECPLPYGANPVNYGGLFPEHFPRYLTNASEDISAYSGSCKFTFIYLFLINRFIFTIYNSFLYLPLNLEN